MPRSPDNDVSNDRAKRRGIFDIVILRDVRYSAEGAMIAVARVYIALMPDERHAVS